MFRSEKWGVLRSERCWGTLHSSDFLYPCSLPKLLPWNRAMTLAAGKWQLLICLPLIQLFGRVHCSFGTTKMNVLVLQMCLLPFFRFIFCFFFGTRKPLPTQNPPTACFFASFVVAGEELSVSEVFAGLKDFKSGILRVRGPLSSQRWEQLWRSFWEQLWMVICFSDLKDLEVFNHVFVEELVFKLFSCWFGHDSPQKLQNPTYFLGAGIPCHFSCLIYCLIDLRSHAGTQLECLDPSCGGGALQARGGA